jgi:hypothetical protein
MLRLGIDNAFVRGQMDLSFSTELPWLSQELYETTRERGLHKRQMWSVTKYRRPLNNNPSSVIRNYIPIIWLQKRLPFTGSVYNSQFGLLIPSHPPASTFSTQIQGAGRYTEARDQRSEKWNRY